MNNNSVKPIVSVTIATYNRKSLLGRVLNSLVNQSAPKSSYELIICDSHSGDGTAELVDTFARESRLIVKHCHTVNVLAAKRNLGINQAEADFVVFLDDDCVPEPDFVARYVSIASDANSDRRAVYCGEVRFPADWCRASNYYRFRDSQHPPSRTSSDYTLLKYSNIVVMNMGFFKREFRESVGSVDENFIGYGCEDIELGWRLVSSGFKIYLAGPRITHYEPSGSIGGMLIKINRSSRDGMRTLLEKQPAAALSWRFFQYLDAEFPGKRSLFASITFAALRALSASRLPDFICRIMEKRDRSACFYFPMVFKSLMAIEHLRGSLIRSSMARARVEDWYA